MPIKKWVRFETKNNLSPNAQDVEFTSDTIKVDEKNKIITASGNVIIINENRKIIAVNIKKPSFENESKHCLLYTSPSPRDS